MNSDKLFIILSYRYRNPERDSNLGPKRLSLLGFETWYLRPLSHHRRLLSVLCYRKIRASYIESSLYPKQIVSILDQIE